MLRKTLTTLAVSSALITLSSTAVMAKTYNHSLGSVEINEVPQRVVVLGYGSLDFIDALGVEPIATPKSLVPETLAKYKSDKYVNTGSLQEADFEALFMAKPDLIIAEARMAKIYKDLKDIAPVYMYQVDNKDYWNTTKAHWENLSEIFNKEEQGDKLIAEVDNEIAQLKTQVAEKQAKALTVMNSGGNITMFGPSSRFSFIYQEAGFEPASSKEVKAKAATHGNLISFEYIADAKPDTLLILDRDSAIGRADKGQAAQMFNNALVNSTPAAQNNNVVYMDSAAWYLTAGGYQSTKIMIADLNKTLK